MSLVIGYVPRFAAALGVFLPVFLVVVIIGPHFERLVRDHCVRQFVQGLTTAATGAIAGSAVILASRVLVNARALWIAAAVVAILAARLKVPEPLLILVAAGVGVGTGMTTGRRGCRRRPGACLCEQKYLSKESKLPVHPPSPPSRWTFA